MTGKQNAVLWIGLIIVALNLAMKWSSIRSIIFAGATGSSSAPSSSSGGGGFNLPIPKWPGTNIPVLSTVAPNPAVTTPTPSNSGVKLV